MIIRKTQQPSDYPSNSISNAKTTGTTNTYSCDYINGIIESGSNDNGSWIKFEDGTMICTNRYFIQTEGNTTTQSGALYVSSEITGKSFPISFTSRPEIFFNFENSTWGDKNIIAIKTIGYPTASVAPAFQLVSTITSTDTAINFEYLAIGKWK